MFFILFPQARYYLPEIGRFISEDSYKGTLPDIQSQNRYIYCTNNTLKYIDPSGHTRIKDLYTRNNKYISSVADGASSIAQPVIDASNGAVDTLSFGFTKWIRDN